MIPARLITLAAATLSLLSTLPARAADPAAPVACVAVDDLALHRAEDRARLAARVETAAADICLSHGDLLTPAHRRGQRSWCEAEMRAALMRAMPTPVRRAYDLGRVGA